MKITIGLSMSYQHADESFRAEFWEMRRPQFDYDESRDSNNMDLERTIKVELYAFASLDDYLAGKNPIEKYYRTERIKYTYKEKKAIQGTDSLTFALSNTIYDKLIQQIDFFKAATKVEVDKTI